MTRTALGGLVPELTPEDAVEYAFGPGKVTVAEFEAEAARIGQRIPQFWTNNLLIQDRDKLIDSAGYDPFYRDSWSSVLTALRYLLEH